MKYIPHILYLILILACGSDDIPEPALSKPNYFPNSIESKWVYQNINDSQWTWLVKDIKTLDNTTYQFLEKTPIIEVYENDYLIPTHYRISDKQILFNISDKIEQYVQTDLPASVQDEFIGLDIKTEVNQISYPELIFLDIPITLNNQWEVYNLRIEGNFILQDLILLTIPFELQLTINGEVISEGPINTLAGRFEKAFQVEYQIDTTHIVFSDEEKFRQTKKIWIVPHVGIVKIDDEHGITELKGINW